MKQELSPDRVSDEVRDLKQLVARLGRDEHFADVIAALGRGEAATIDGAWGSSCALATAAVAAAAGGPLLIVLPRVGDVEDFSEDLAAFGVTSPAVFPAAEVLPGEHDPSDRRHGTRLRIQAALGAPDPPAAIVTGIAALLQPVASATERDRSTRRLAVGESLDLEHLVAWLVDAGLVATPAVELPGEFSRHGGIVDLFAPDSEDPLRIEFFGDEIESIRSFDAETQQKLEQFDEVTVCLARPPGGPAEGTHLVDGLPRGGWVVLVDLPELKRQGDLTRDRLGRPDSLFAVEDVFARLTDVPSIRIDPLPADSSETTCHLVIESIERFEGLRTGALDEFAGSLGPGDRALIVCHNAAERSRLAELLAEHRARHPATDRGSPALEDRVTLCLGHLGHGFRLVSEQLVVLSDHELFRRSEVPATGRRARVESRAIDTFLDLEPNDLVVHLTHGIARYRGLRLLDRDDQAEEHLVLEFRGRVQVYVPVSLIHLVQKYVGGARSAPDLSRIGTRAWSNRKARVAEAVGDLAADMIRLQAARASRPGIAHPADSHWQREFEASFPYTETADQQLAIEHCRTDLEAPRPMDRLICGDVGYGKTEVAMRAAFKTIDGGRQVAILVPTTVLAEQHYRTFSERMAEFPVSIDVLSRFKTRREQRLVLERLKHGRLDLVIGTHRLIQKDVAFRDLGLLVIDEEQRFGVDAKETLKRLRLEVDMLAMTATPIPRTLHMALLGIRDISNLETPPRDRRSIVTRLVRFDAEMIRQAIVRELNRNGQVFFVHNRVHNIQSIADRLRQIVPEARLDVAHGQMREGALEAAMLKFVSGRTDVLVATTIIESGLDIPNANTIFIHEADRYGLADLHQLRGRVGRYHHRAYCYVLLPDDRPVSTVAARRLKAIEEYSELGSGFRIAMRDLEIRGAGNILGTQQSGHIVSIGYELYCQLLEDAVRRLKNLPPQTRRHVAIDLPLTAYLPEDFVPPGRHKIDLYRRLAAVETGEQLEAVTGEIRERFGPPPLEARRLLAVKALELAARAWGVVAVRIEPRRDGEGPFAVFGYDNVDRIASLVELDRHPLRIVDGREAYLRLDPDDASGDSLLVLIKSVLRPR